MTASPQPTEASHALTRVRVTGEHHPAGNHTAADITRGVVKRYNDATGRGPTKARAYLSEEVITVVLRDSLTRLEQTLISHGQDEVVLATRSALHTLLTDDLIGLVTDITGTPVSSIHFDHRIDADVAVVTFLLADPPRRPTT